MAFSWFDIVALVMLLLGVVHGWKAGFIVMIGNLLSLILGIVASAYVSTWLASNWGLSGIGAVVAFIVVALVVAKLLRIVVWLIDKVWKVISIIPFLGPLNRLLGVAVGVIEAGVLIVVLTYLFMNFWMPNVGGLMDSVVFTHAYAIAGRLSLFLPSF